MAEKLTIIADTREKQPWTFGSDVMVVRGTLTTGDYSILGLADRVAIERKNLGDLVGTVIQDWLRFRKELYRLAGMDLACVMVEASIEDIREHRYESEANPDSVLGRVNSIIIDHGVQVLFCGSRVQAVHMAERLLRQAAKKYGGMGG